MAKGNADYEREFIETVKEKTGKTLDEWFAIIKESGETKPAAILNWLKQTQGLNHLQANFLQGIYLNDGKPVYDHAVLFSKLFQDIPDLLPTYNAFEARLKSALPETLLVPTKAYISLEGKKIYGCVTPTKKLLRIGLDLGDVPFGDYVQKAKSLGAMPNVTHMIEIMTTAEVSDSLIDFATQAYHRVNG